MTDISNYEEYSLLTLFMSAHRNYFGKCFKQTANLCVHPGQIPILLFLGEHKDVSQKEIASEIGVKPPTVNVMVSRMEKAGLLSKIPDENDQRATRIYLTAKGMKLRTQILKRLKLNEKHVFDGFDTAEKCLLRRFFMQIIYNIDAMPDQYSEDEVNAID